MNMHNRNLSGSERTLTPFTLSFEQSCLYTSWLEKTASYNIYSAVVAIKRIVCI